MTVSVSVIIPSYNSGRFVEEALDSALAPGPVELEVIVQDAGSTDETLAILKRNRDPRLRWFSEPDRGQTDALNRAIKRSTGEWVLWLNADDRVAPGALEAVKPLLGGPYDVIFGDYCIVSSDGRTSKTYRVPPELSRSRLFRYGTYLFSGATYFRRRLLDEVGPLDESLLYCMDFDLFVRVAPLARSTHAKAILAHFRRQPDAKTSVAPWAGWREHGRVARRYGAFDGEHRLTALLGQAYQAAYLATRGVWQSDAWRRFRPERRRGGGGNFVS